MRKFKLILLAISLPVCLAAQCSSALVSSGVYGPAQGASGPAQYVVFMPQPASCYKGDVLLFAHGYIAPGSPANTWLSQLALPDGTTLPALVNSLGFGFAASSFSKDGLAVLQGIQDTKALENVIAGLSIPVHKYFVTGASEGGLVATKSVENDSSYGGGLAVCGPIGNFQDQLNYFGNVRVLFDYFFPGVLTTHTPGESAMRIPPALIANWYTVYAPAARNAMNANPLATLQLVLTGQIPIGLSFGNAADAVLQVLAYNVFATTDAEVTLGGVPFDNIRRTYFGSFNDARLNAQVARFAEDAAAIASVHAYETTGILADPLVTLHTLFDPVVPFWQEPLYALKALPNLSKLLQIPTSAYGHCNVTAAQVGGAFEALLSKAGL
jgi:hypothetical protein